MVADFCWPKLLFVLEIAQTASDEFSSQGILGAIS
jgi:hypothetical protein